MNEHIIEDDFGRRTIFAGELLVQESTDNTRGDKPQWLEVEVWRTQAGSFVVRRTTRYRVRHLRQDCEKADGYDLAPATPTDTQPCRHCNRAGETLGGWRQEDRVTVDAYMTPQDLILGFQSEGRFTTLSRAILADVADLDDRVDSVWNTVVVP